ncbi:MAG: hypothetical protein IH606_07850 [Burkholderiales bacterium]|nr:hypothetical protein [Burkholderiales bacterium]
MARPRTHLRHPGRVHPERIAEQACGSAAAALVALACAFGPMPDQPGMRDAVVKEAGARLPRGTIETFLLDSRRHLGL